MNETLGKRIAEFRKSLGLKQDDIAQKLNLSAQAISKWENDLTSPDISILPELAGILGVTIDELILGEAAGRVRMLKEEKKQFERMTLHIVVMSPSGEKTQVRLPMPVVEAAIETQSNDFLKLGSDELQSIDIEFILDCAKRGMIGKLVEVECSDKTVVSICVEQK